MAVGTPLPQVGGLCTWQHGQIFDVALLPDPTLGPCACPRAHRGSHLCGIWPTRFAYLETQTNWLVKNNCVLSYFTLFTNVSRLSYITDHCYVKYRKKGLTTSFPSSVLGSSRETLSTPARFSTPSATTRHFQKWAGGAPPLWSICR